jgi:DNA-3-methyladenine glycosylase
VLLVARDLLGCRVSSSVGGVVELEITEVEAYAGETDPGSHGFRGRTRRNATMFGPPGRAYVYFTYGMHWCLNLVCGADQQCRAVLIRAGTVVEGVEVARTRRGSAVREVDLARGPARLTRALGIDGGYDGVDVTRADSPLRVCSGVPVADEAVRSGPRVGVSGAGALTPWRFWVAGAASVSAYRPAAARPASVRT